MSQEYPSPSEFRSDSPRFVGVAVGCTISTLEALLVRYLRNGLGTLNQTVLGRSAGARCRAAHPPSNHGIAPHPWCGRCVYLEAKARGLPVQYGHLTITQLRQRARAHLPMSLSIWYGSIHKVTPTSYSAHVPARGRSDRFVGSHQVVVWRAIVDQRGNVTAYVVSDPDFGSAARHRVPPYSIIDRAEFEAAFRHLNYGVVQLTKRPPALRAA